MRLRVQEQDGEVYSLPCPLISGIVSLRHADQHLLVVSGPRCCACWPFAHQYRSSSCLFIISGLLQSSRPLILISFHHDPIFHRYFFAAAATLCLNTGLLTTSPFPTWKKGLIIVFIHASYTSTKKFLTASSVAGLVGLYSPCPPPRAARPPARLPLAPPPLPVSPRLSSRGRVSSRNRVFAPVIQHEM